MFDQVLENVRRATEFNIRTQQRLFKKWAGLCTMPGIPNPAGEQITKVQEQWTEFVTGLAKKQRETMEPHFKTSLKILEEACGLVEAKDPEDLRTKTIELWQKSFQCMRQVCESQLYDFEHAVGQWLELVTKVSTEASQTMCGAEAPAA